MQITIKSTVLQTQSLLTSFRSGAVELVSSECCSADELLKKTEEFSLDFTERSEVKKKFEADESEEKSLDEVGTAAEEGEEERIS